MFETVAWISIIIGFVVVIAFSLTAMLLTRRREQNAPAPVDHEEAVRKVDAAADAALDEINKTAGLILKDIEEKYQTLLFLYELMEEKKNNIPEQPLAQPSLTQPLKRPVVVSKPVSPSGKAAKLDVVINDDVELPKRKAMILNPKQERIVELFNGGMLPGDIAKELDMGQGEVRLILDLSHVG